jgi:hypothetical protein
LLEGEGHFQYGNNVLGVITPEATLEEFDFSLFTSEIPTYLEEANSSFPLIGFPNNPVENSLPAQIRFINGSIISDCIISNTTELNEDIEQKNVFKLFPNPTSGQINWESNEEISEINLFTLNGLKVKSYLTNSWIGKLNLSGLTAGIYLVEITNKEGVKTRKRIVIR